MTDTTLDVFLCYRASDSPLAGELAERLSGRGLTVWPEGHEGIPSEDADSALRRTNSAAVLIGRGGPDAQQDLAMRVSLQRMTTGELRLVPVILPGATTTDLPPLLKNFVCIDMGSGFNEAGLDRLHWGITGVKP